MPRMRLNPYQSERMSKAWVYSYTTLRERGVERVKGVHHITVITWVKQIGELDELETFVGSKKTKFGCELVLTTSEKGF